MKSNIKIIIFIILGLFNVGQSRATCNIYENIEPDTTQLDIRINPTLEQDTCSHPLVKEYNYLKLNKNYISYNNSDWTDFYNKLNNSSQNVVSIVHIGDSHLQADIATGKSRELLQKQFGNAGRGIVAPLKLAKTNQPTDYFFTCGGSYDASSLMRRPWKSPIKLTGASFTPHKENFSVEIGTKNSSNEFKRLRIHLKGDLYIDSVCADNKVVSYEIDERFPNYTDIIFSESVSHVKLWLSSIGQLTIYGASLLNDCAGVVYNVIGNNGASYYSYNNMGDLGRDCQILSPDLFIISLGANEAFGNLSNEAFYTTISNLTNDLLSHNPNASILLATPMECQKNGRINNKIKQFRDVIIQFGIDNNIAVYDWYEIAGGYNASNNWVNDRLMGKDRIHNTSNGYHIQGTILYEAIINELKKY